MIKYIKTFLIKRCFTNKAECCTISFDCSDYSHPHVRPQLEYRVLIARVLSSPAEIRTMYARPAELGGDEATGHQMVDTLLRH